MKVTVANTRERQEAIAAAKTRRIALCNGR
jgi:hypothetical protein